MYHQFLASKMDNRCFDDLQDEEMRLDESSAMYCGLQTHGRLWTLLLICSEISKSLEKKHLGSQSNLTSKPVIGALVLGTGQLWCWRTWAASRVRCEPRVRHAQ